MNKTISLCMIVKNEGKHLRRCIESVNDKVDEIIIIDTGSSDSTIEIARQYTSLVYNYEWMNDFSAARNYSLQFATSDYILVLDADEYLDSSVELQNDIQSAADYYLMTIRNVLSYGGAFTHLAVRLFVNRKDLFYQNRLHEHLNILDEKCSFKGERLNSIIHHTGYTNEIMEEKSKILRNIPLMKKEVEENPDAYNLYNMGKTYMSAGENEQADVYFQKAYPLSLNRLFLPELITKLSWCLGESNKYNDALRILSDAVYLFPNDTEMHYVQGKLFKESGYYRDAELAFQKCLELGDQGEMLTEGSGGYMARFSMVDLYESQNRIAESYDQIIQIIRTNKSFIPALKKYLEIVTNSNVPLDDVYMNIGHIYNISNINDLQTLLDTLYSLRHPLLHRFVVNYNINIQKHVVAAAKQYSKLYEEAKYEWMKLKKLEMENRDDVLLLALILKDKELYDLTSKDLNFNNKDIKLLKSIILDTVTDQDNKLSWDMESLLLKFSEKLIELQEFEIFEALSKVIFKGSIKTRCNFCDKLVKFGFDELAIDLLSGCFKEQPNNIGVLRLLGDSCMRAGYLEDAQLFYSKLLNLNPEYSTYERCYNLYEKMQDLQGMEIIIKEITKKFPLAKWVTKLK